jgi:hypothetical protein
MPSARGVRDAAILGAAGLAGVYAFEAAQYRRSGAKGFDLENPPSPGTSDFASTRSGAVALSRNAPGKPSKVEALLHGRAQEGVEPLDRVYELSSLSGEVEAV